MTDQNQTAAELYARKKQIRRALERLVMARKQFEDPYCSPEVFRENMGFAITHLESILSRGMPPEPQ